MRSTRRQKSLSPPSRLEETYEGYARSRRKQRSWAADNPGNIAIRAELLAAILELGSTTREGKGEVLDIGCGGGWLLGELRDRGIDERRLHGVDLIDSRLDAARRRLPGADIRHADATALPHDDDSFGLVTMLTALSSMPREMVGPALHEARRIVAPGGVVLVYEPRIANPFNRATVRISKVELESALGPATASLRLTGFPPLARRLGRSADRLYPRFARLVPTHRLTAH